MMKEEEADDPEDEVVSEDGSNMVLSDMEKPQLGGDKEKENLNPDQKNRDGERGTVHPKPLAHPTQSKNSLTKKRQKTNLRNQLAKSCSTANAGALVVGNKLATEPSLLGRDRGLGLHGSDVHSR